MAHGFYERKPDSGTEFLTEDGETDTVEDVIEFDVDEGAWLVWDQDFQRVHIQLEGTGWAQVG